MGRWVDRAVSNRGQQRFNIQPKRRRPTALNPQPSICAQNPGSLFMLIESSSSWDTKRIIGLDTPRGDDRVKTRLKT